MQIRMFCKILYYGMFKNYVSIFSKLTPPPLPSLSMFFTLSNHLIFSSRYPIYKRYLVKSAENVYA